MKIYIGKAFSIPSSTIFKIGFTNRTCYKRCRTADYTIFGAVELPITPAEGLFVESYVRLGFNAMTEVKKQIRNDYFLLQKKFAMYYPNGTKVKDLKKWGYSWLLQFVSEAIEIINEKRSYSNTSLIELKNKDCYCGSVFSKAY